MIRLEPGSGGFGYVAIGTRGSFEGHLAGIVPNGTTWSLCNSLQLSLAELQEIVALMAALPPPDAEQLERYSYYANRR